MADDFRKLQQMFGEAVRGFRQKKLLTNSEQSRLRADFDDKLSRQDVATVADARREIERLSESLNGRKAPKSLSAKGRKTFSATFPSEDDAAGFLRLWRVKDTGAYGMKRDGKSHPDDHRRHAVGSGAEAWGGKVAG